MLPCCWWARRRAVVVVVVVTGDNENATTHKVGVDPWPNVLLATCMATNTINTSRNTDDDDEGVRITPILLQL